MIDLDDEDQLLNLLGVILILFIISSVAFLVFTATDTSPSQQETDPEVNWTLERLNATHVQITHGGGDSVVVENLSVTVNGRPRPVSWSGRLMNGDIGKFRSERGDVIRLYWTGGRSDWELLKLERNL